MPPIVGMPPTGSVFPELIGSSCVDGHTVYTIEVSLELAGSSTHWIVTRRYSEFRELHRQLAQLLDRALLPAMPGKRLFGNLTASFVAQRQAELKSYLDAVMRLALTEPESLTRSGVGRSGRGTMQRRADVEPCIHRFLAVLGNKTPRCSPLEMGFSNRFLRLLSGHRRMSSTEGVYRESVLLASGECSSIMTSIVEEERGFTPRRGVKVPRLDLTKARAEQYALLYDVRIEEEILAERTPSPKGEQAVPAHESPIKADRAVVSRALFVGAGRARSLSCPLLDGKVGHVEF